MVFRTPWQGNPRVNIQRAKNGMAKPYQVQQVLSAVEKMKEDGEWKRLTWCSTTRIE